MRVGEDDGGGAVAEVEFRQDVSEVRFYRRFADEEGRGDLRVGRALTDQPQYVPFAIGELSQGRAISNGHPVCAAVRFEHLTGYAGIEPGAAGRDIKTRLHVDFVPDILSAQTRRKWSSHRSWNR